MTYLIIIFLFILIIGILANRELAGDKKRIKSMIRQYSYKTYSPEEEEEKEKRPEKEKNN